ncbi:hypothetical protein B0H16DRAFT_1739421 [Mycena metata]|uniref:CxC2-like cysteine cluster KDZ transposase-associated domain-containing protein n=1 Tax=Mycena metata TaxID=1033252 RepID=A0AAD7MJC2_9AGAR|nr:hypothetical protein B0H16DRAFT_1739421 [Mycena metata]
MSVPPLPPIPPWHAAAHAANSHPQYGAPYLYSNTNSAHSHNVASASANSSDDEGHTSDSDPDLPPPLEDEDNYLAARRPPRGYDLYPRLVSEPHPVVVDEYDPAHVHTGDDENERIFYLTASDNHKPLRPQPGMEPRGSSSTPCCRCYCTCSLCITTDAAAVELAWPKSSSPPSPGGCVDTRRLPAQALPVSHRGSWLLLKGFRRTNGLGLKELNYSDERIQAIERRIVQEARAGKGEMWMGEQAERMWANEAGPSTSREELEYCFKRLEIDAETKPVATSISFAFLILAGEAVASGDGRRLRRTLPLLPRPQAASGLWHMQHNSSRGRRNADTLIHYETSAQDLSSDIGFYPSVDGRRARHRAFNTGPKTTRVTPSELRDPYADWEPVPDDREGWDDGGGGGEAAADGVMGEKRKQYLSSEWNGNYWNIVTLQHLGLIYQLGHGGLPCKRPHPVERTLVVIHTNGIYTVKYHFCGCNLSDHANNLRQFMRNKWYPASTVDPGTCATYECLDLYRLLNVVGNINVHDFVRSVERLTDATKITKVPDCYKSFGYMARQYAFLGRLRRTGQSHNAGGVDATENGACALLCWACSHDKINLPEGWRNVAPEFKFLYMLILAIDANFRLKNRMRKNEHDDPSFGSGWGYFVEEGPYKKHLRGYVAEKDVSTCIAFAALLQKDTRMTTGLRCSGVGGVVCARHEVLRPQGMGDLQKGERYSNMDYIFMSSILGVMLLCLAASYNIVFKPPADLDLKFGLPVWHAAAHEEACRTQNSLSYVEGVGRTDGEGIERTWSELNPMGWATKEMGNGGRHDALEDKIDHHNWEKNIGQGDTLARKLVVAIEERDRQVAAFAEVDTTLRSDVRKDWLAKIEEWQADRSKPNPYMSQGRRSGPSEATVRQELKKDELNDGADGVYTKGATAFLVISLQLEDLQSMIRLELKGKTLLSGDQTGRVQELRLRLLTKLKTFRDLQGRHMPGAIRRIEEEEEGRDPDLPAPNPEDIELWMPSELTRAERTEECAKGLAGREARLHEANSHIVGQKQATRSSTLIGLVGEHVDTIAGKYRRARAALAELKTTEYCTSKGLRELLAADVRLDEEWEPDAAARHRSGRIGSGNHRHRNEPTIPSRQRVFSWIWTAVTSPDTDVEGLHDSVRIEWSKARARRDRWVEEVQLLREEMRRVMRFLQWKAAWWESRRYSRGREIPQALVAGLAAYAARQAALHRGIARRFRAGWDTSRSAVVRMVAMEDARLLAEDSLAEGMAAFVTAAAAGEGEQGPAAEGEGEGRGEGDQWGAGNGYEGATAME